MNKIQCVIILAGGDGDRFAPLIHKIRFPFCGKTTLRYIVESVGQLSEKIVIVTNLDNQEGIRQDLMGHSVEYVQQTSDKGGMADAVISAEKYLTHDSLILNGNDLFDFGILPDFIEKTRQEKNKVGIVAKYMKTYFPGGYVRFENENVSAIVEKPLPEAIPSHYVKLTADYFTESASFLTELKSQKPSDDQYERAISALIRKSPAACMKYTGDWTTLKYSWHVLAMQEYSFEHFLQNHTDPSLKQHPTSIIEGEVFIGKDVKIGAFSKITGPAYIADGAVVGDHSLIRSSTIGKGCLIGSCCEVARSYLGDGVMLHRNYVGDSVLSRGSTMGAGAVTANFRFDGLTIKTPIKDLMIDTTRTKFGLIAGENTKLGVNSCTYPGVKLSQDSVVFPAEVVKKDK